MDDVGQDDRPRSRLAIEEPLQGFAHGKVGVYLPMSYQLGGFLVVVPRSKIRVLSLSGEEGLRLAREAPPEILILDVMLPKMTGLDVCKQLRAAGSTIPIIMLTARGQEIDKVLGLKLGADDYVTKPFSFMELMARVEAAHRVVGPMVTHRSASGSWPSV